MTLANVVHVKKNVVYHIPGFVYDEENPQYDCFMPCYTGDFWIVDCMVCDKNKKIHPGYNVAGVPIHTERLIQIHKK